MGVLYGPLPPRNVMISHVLRRWGVVENYTPNSSNQCPGWTAPPATMAAPFSTTFSLQYVAGPDDEAGPYPEGGFRCNKPNFSASITGAWTAEVFGLKGAPCLGMLGGGRKARDHAVPNPDAGLSFTNVGAAVCLRGGGDACRRCESSAVLPLAALHHPGSGQGM